MISRWATGTSAIATQTRSYFALRLPHRWWLWGIDLQFGDYLDEAQLAYFAEAAQDLEQGDRVIVCMAKEKRAPPLLSLRER